VKGARVEGWRLKNEVVRERGEVQEWRWRKEGWRLESMELKEEKKKSGMDGSRWRMDGWMDGDGEREDGMIKAE
jgi:hypothetical protein